MALTEEQRQKRMDELKAEREKRAADAAAARAKSDPMKDPTNRPVAPPPDSENVYYYGWVGGVTSGQWKLYKESQMAPSDKVQSATIRSEGGETQATFSSSVGANQLALGGSYTPGVGFTNPDTAPKGTVNTNNIGTGDKITPGENGIPVGFTPGQPPAGLKAVFGDLGSYSGYRIVTNPDGTKSLQVATGPSGYSTLGARFTIDANGNYVPVAMSGSSNVSGSGSDVPGSTGNINTTGMDPATAALIQSLQSQIASLTAKTDQAKIDQAAADALAKKEKTESAIAVLTDRFNRYGLASLVPKIKELAIGGASESTITLQLQETEEYKQRFRANQDRIKKGLSVLDPGDYLALEDDYRQILRAYGLRQFDNDDYVTQFISNDISTTELSNRVVTAVQRVQNADPAVLTTLRGFYGISDNDLVAYVLDPNQQFQKIERQVAAAEIGAAASLQGLSAGVAVSEQLAAQGVTKAQAQKGYATIADILPTAEKLSDIYKGTEDEYRQAEAEQEVFNTLASAQRKRQKLTQREIAAFSGTSGLSKASLSKQLGGNI